MFWPILMDFGAIFRDLGRVCAIWAHFGQFGGISAYFGKSGGIWAQFGYFGGIRDLGDLAGFRRILGKFR